MGPALGTHWRSTCRAEQIIVLLHFLNQLGQTSSSESSVHSLTRTTCTLLERYDGVSFTANVSYAPLPKPTGTDKFFWMLSIQLVDSCRKAIIWRTKYGLLCSSSHLSASTLTISQNYAWICSSQTFTLLRNSLKHVNITIFSFASEKTKRLSRNVLGLTDFFGKFHVNTAAT